MRDTTRNGLNVVRISLLASALLAVLSIGTLVGQSRMGLAPVAQDPPASPPYVSLAPDNLDFGDQVVGWRSVAKRITLKNTGGSALNIDSVELGGDNPTAFAISRDTCTGATVEADKACIVDVTFTPARTGGRNARLKINDNALDSPQRLRLKGNGINSSAVPPF
ncbi:MAG: choice-of-anchor D domain-containing protein [Pyrinomonadaceae bacterium]|nr:choice-of-anchor D domain-containing protein [Pyrinomonadaceae bacterium]